MNPFDVVVKEYVVRVQSNNVLHSTLFVSKSLEEAYKFADEMNSNPMSQDSFVVVENTYIPNKVFQKVLG